MTRSNAPKRPYFPLFPSDFLGSRRTRRLSMAARAVLLEALMASWEEPLTAGSLKGLASMRGWGDGWERLWDEVVSERLFALHGKEWRNGKLEALRLGPTASSRKKARQRKGDMSPLRRGGHVPHPNGSGSGSGLESGYLSDAETLEQSDGPPKRRKGAKKPKPTLLERRVAEHLAASAAALDAVGSAQKMPPEFRQLWDAWIVARAKNPNGGGWTPQSQHSVKLALAALRKAPDHATRERMLIQAADGGWCGLHLSDEGSRFAGASTPPKTRDDLLFETGQRQREELERTVWADDPDIQATRRRIIENASGPLGEKAAAFLVQQAKDPANGHG